MQLWAGIIRAFAGTAMLCAATHASAQPTDTAVKAAFLPRFARYVTWPPAAMPRGSDPFQLCVVGGDPFGAMLDDAAGSQLIDGRRIAVRRMDSATGLDSCQIAFVSGNRAGQMISAIGRRPVLTVTDSASSGGRGIIHFAVVGGHVRFFIDQSVAAQHGLSISSRLLALAVGVRQ